MELKTILSGIEGIKARGDLELQINSIECDSRMVKENSLFIAIKGFDVDGNTFIKSAVENGAKAIVIEEGTKLKKSDILLRLSYIGYILRK